MKRFRHRTWLCGWTLLGVLAAGLSSSLVAQDTPASAPAEASAPTAFSEADFEAVLEQLSPEEMEKLVQSAARRCLEVERRQVAAEIRENLLYDENDVTKALGLLNAASETPLTQQQNIERICKAFAIVDDRFTGAYNLYSAGKFAKSAERLKETLNPEDASYFSAAVHYLYADSMIRQEKYWPGTEAYSDLLVNLPDRISFASAAALRAAQTYERMGRNLYAMQMYAYCLRNYALTMSKEDLTKVAERFETLERRYRDPMSSLTGMITHIHSRLEKQDIGQGTQKRQEEVVALLEDLIKTTEEKQRPKKNSKPKKKQRRPGEKKQGQAKKDGGSKQGPPKGTPRNPTVGATESVLVPGPVSRPNKLAKIHAASEAGAWAELPPREKEKIRNLMRQRLAERRGQMVRDYHKKLAEGE